MTLSRLRTSVLNRTFSKDQQERKRIACTFAKRNPAVQQQEEGEDTVERDMQEETHLAGVCLASYQNQKGRRRRTTLGSRAVAAGIPSKGQKHTAPGSRERTTAGSAGVVVLFAAVVADRQN